MSVKPLPADAHQRQRSDALPTDHEHQREAALLTFRNRCHRDNGWIHVCFGKRGILQKHGLQNIPRLPKGTTWINYIRCHDDIGLGATRPEMSVKPLPADAHQRQRSDALPTDHEHQREAALLIAETDVIRGWDSCSTFR